MMRSEPCAWLGDVEKDDRAMYNIRMGRRAPWRGDGRASAQWDRTYSERRDATEVELGLIVQCIEQQKLSQRLAR
jgi:hypothetical protein